MTILVLAVWLGFRLSEGPLNLALLTPYVEDALTRPDGHLAVKLDKTILVWNDAARTLEIRAEGVHAMAAQHGVIAAVPEMSLTLSGPSLFRGVIAPRAVRLIHPSIRLRRETDGHVRFGVGDVQDNEDSTPAVAESLKELLTPSGEDSVAGQLQRIDIVDGDLMIDDEGLGKTWHAPSANVQLWRQQQRILGHARITLDLDGEPARLDADGSYDDSQRAIEATLSYGGIRPSLFAALAPQLQPLAAFHLPTGGSLNLRYGLDQGLTDVHFDLVGGEGVVDASPWLGMSWPVESVALRGSLSDRLNRLALDEFRVDLGGPVATLEGEADNLGGAMIIQAAARVEDLPLDSLKNLWPSMVAPNPRNWILANLSRGKVRLATAKLAAHIPSGKTLADLTVDAIGGEITPEGVTVQYLKPMPPVRNVSALATFDANVFTINIKGGSVTGLKVESGKVALSGLSAANQSADIDLKIAGPVADALRLIDSKPLGWAQALGVQPSKVKGDAITTLNLQFPLLQNLSFDQVSVHARAQTNHLGMPGVALGLDMAEGNMALDVDAKGMDVSGKAQIGGMPADVKWRENFSKAAPFRSRYQVTTVLDDAARSAIGLDVAPFQPPFLTGPVPTEVVATLAGGGRGAIDVKADLVQAAMRLPGLNWQKDAGVSGSAHADLRLVGGRLDEVPHFTVTSADGLDVEGRVDFNEGHAQRVTFQKAKWRRNDLTGTLTIKPGGGLAIEVSGPSFDARELVAGEPSDPVTDRAPERKTPHPDDHKKEDQVPLAIEARVGQVWVTDDGVVKNVLASLSRDRRDWRQARIDGNLGGDRILHMEIHPADADRRAVRITSTDAGTVFRDFHVFQNVVGGQLLVEGYYDDADPQQPLKGLATVTNYQVVKAPALARLLTVAALTGIVELLAGDGIHFSTLEAPFKLTDGVLDLHDARASGASLGITAKGQVDLDNDMLALEGTIVPVYVLNSVLGHIPVVGSLFSAEKGGGIFAMNYSMKGPSRDPNVMVNPLSALTPGFLRNLFNIFDDGSGTAVRPKEGAISAPSASPAPPPTN